MHLLHQQLFVKFSYKLTIITYTILYGILLLTIIANTILYGILFLTIITNTILYGILLFYQVFSVLKGPCGPAANIPVPAE